MADETTMNGETAGGPAGADLRLGEGFAAGLVVGVLLGAGMALLFAPERGSRTRRELRRRGRRLRARLERARDRLG